MNFGKRAFLNNLRKPGKTILLFVFLLLMSTLMLACFSISSATETAAFHVRKSLGGSFTVNAKQLSGGLSEEQVKEIMSVPGLTGEYTVRSYTKAVFSNMDGADMQIQTAGAATIPEGYEHAGKIVGSSDTSRDTYFTEAGFTMVEGEAIKPQTKGAALVHQSFAKANHLSVGGLFCLTDVEHGNKIQIQVTGIFTNTKKQDAAGVAPSYDLYENTVFVDAVSCSDLIFGTAIKSFQYGDFYVEDPEELGRILKNVQQIKDVQWEDCILTQYDKEYQNAKEALKAMQDIVLIAIWIITAISSTLFILILTLWIRERIHEFGVLLAMGISKADILFQQISELIFAAVPALFFSFGTGKLAARQISRMLIGQVSQETLQVDVTVTTIDWFRVSGAGILFILGAVIISASPILRMKPKNILSKMN